MNSSAKTILVVDDEHGIRETYAAIFRIQGYFLSILSIKRGNWFYWAEKTETAERAEIKESPLLAGI